MLRFYFLLTFYLYPFTAFELDYLKGWNYINLHCRDDNNKPVDWWYLYKPPRDVGEFDSGRHFNFITPNTGGRWRLSDRYITANSMLQHTLSPLFRPTYADYLAMVAYDEHKVYGTKNGSSGSGVVLADEMGGIWLSHTVPGLLDLHSERPTFPEKEIENGHMIICLSLDLMTMNEVASGIRNISPNILSIRVPPALKTSLPDWQYMRVPLNQPLNFKTPETLQFLTKGKTLRAEMMVRSPGDRRCLYKTFARSRRIVLDIYGHDKRRHPICDVNYRNLARFPCHAHNCAKFHQYRYSRFSVQRKHTHCHIEQLQRGYNGTLKLFYSLRNIKAISLKYPEQKVYYINNEMDRIGFAVSTAAHWQRRSSDTPQFWTCTSTLETEDVTSKGGLILCVEDYHVWSSFDNLKIKEPEC